MILLLGESGYIGEAFKQRFVDKGIEFFGLSRSGMDYTNYETIMHFLHANAANFDILINCAGYVGKPNVDACENNKEECIEGNVILPQMLSALCSEVMIKFMHISSGCIYNGYDKEFTEEDPPNFSFEQNNCSFYSGTKALAEKLINKNNSYICRLRIPFDNINSPRNYLSKLMTYDKLLNMQNSISHRADFVDACLHLYQENCIFGTYNITNTGSVDTEQVCSLIGKHLSINNFNFFDSEEEFYNIGATAPRSNCLLDNSKLLSTGFEMRTTEEALVDSLERWEK